MFYSPDTHLDLKVVLIAASVSGPLTVSPTQLSTVIE